MSPFEKRGTDINIESDDLKNRAAAEIKGVDHSSRSRLAQDDPLEGMKGPMTRSKTKKMQEALNQLIREVHDNIKMFKLTKSNESTCVTVLQVITSQSTSSNSLKLKEAF